MTPRSAGDHNPVPADKSTSGRPPLGPHARLPRPRHRRELVLKDGGLLRGGGRAGQATEGHQGVIVDENLEEEV